MRGNNRWKLVASAGVGTTVLVLLVAVFLPYTFWRRMVLIPLVKIGMPITLHATEEDFSKYPRQDSIDNAWSEQRRHVAIPLRVGPGKFVDARATFLRVPELEPYLLLIEDLGTGPVTTAFPTLPPLLAISLARAVVNADLEILPIPVGDPITLTGEDAVQFVKNGPSPEQIRRLRPPG